jgi:glyoxylase-like metal-dependent hydrolase (beta-lactamase superfamily II)
LQHNQDGFYNFFSSYLVIHNEKIILIDPGPVSSLELLLKNLKDFGISYIDYILLTHIHLDHAGCIGHLCELMEVKKVFCHLDAIPHLINPAKLWLGSIKIQGDFANFLGQPKALSKDKITDVQNIKEFFETSLVYTPGHAVHHVSFVIEQYIFVGEALGVVCPTNLNYSRPATPHRFLYSVYLDSIEKLSSFKAKKICFAHYGIRDDKNLADYCERAKLQINVWVKTLTEFLLANLELRKTQSQQREYICLPEEVCNKLLTTLIEEDTLFSSYSKLPNDLKKRELQFIANSLNGIYNSI